MTRNQTKIKSRRTHRATRSNFCAAPKAANRLAPVAAHVSEPPAGGAIVELPGSHSSRRMNQCQLVWRNGSGDLSKTCLADKFSGGI